MSIFYLDNIFSLIAKGMKEIVQYIDIKSNYMCIISRLFSRLFYNRWWAYRV